MTIDQFQSTFIVWFKLSEITKHTRSDNSLDMQSKMTFIAANLADSNEVDEHKHDKGYLLATSAKIIPQNLNHCKKGREINQCRVG